MHLNPSNIGIKDGRDICTDICFAELHKLENPKTIHRELSLEDYERHCCVTNSGTGYELGTEQNLRSNPCLETNDSVSAIY
jgi:hypothetical protein